ncbi:hypothetical protein B0H13DRAFT_1885576 [Mycena leptocephala]|nr:hypothetical protein B0H13DRAFT_1885576 [Mycena leptocephala]
MEGVTPMDVESTVLRSHMRSHARNGSDAEEPVTKAWQQNIRSYAHQHSTDTRAKFLTLTNHRNNPGPNGVPGIYQAALDRLGAYSLASHEIDRTFTRSIDNDEKQGKTFIAYVNIGNKKTSTAHMKALDVMYLKLEPTYELVKSGIGGDRGCFDLGSDHILHIPSKVNHIYVDKLWVLDHGYGHGPSSPKKHNDAFKAAESVAQEIISALTN